MPHKCGVENREVYLTFNPRFERIWLESLNIALPWDACDSFL